MYNDETIEACRACKPEPKWNKPDPRRGANLKMRRDIKNFRKELSHTANSGTKSSFIKSAKEKGN